MNETDTQESTEAKPEREPHRVRLPGFISDEEIGLGDVIKRVTYAFRNRAVRRL